MVRSRLLRVVLFACGCVCLGLGAVGVVVRGLPTTPFLLLAAAAFSRSSERMNRWITTHPRIGPFLTDLRDGKGLSARTKIYSLSAAWLLIGVFALFIAGSTLLQVLLLLLLLIKTVVLTVVIPTKRGVS